jgi:hypothetical protein
MHDFLNLIFDGLFLQFFSLPLFFLIVDMLLSALILSSSTLAGSSFGSWGTSSLHAAADRWLRIALTAIISRTP